MIIRIFYKKKKNQVKIIKNKKKKNQIKNLN